MRFLYCWRLLLHLALLSLSTSLMAWGMPCPKQCSCLEENKGPEMKCSVSSSSQWTSMCREIKMVKNPETIRLTLAGHSIHFISRINCLPEVLSLDLSNTLLVLKPRMFTGLKVSNLFLSSNSIKQIPAQTFLGLEGLKGLDLSWNHIESVESLFHLKSLSVLDLSHNLINSLSLDSFSGLSSLKSLNLKNNSLEDFALGMLLNTPSLELLNLQNNLLRTFYLSENETEDLVIHSMKSIDLSGNPLECSCVVGQLMKKLSSLTVLQNPFETTCQTPKSLLGKAITTLDGNLFNCSVPKEVLSHPISGTQVLAMSHVSLKCTAQGYPQPSIMWVTPWGHAFCEQSKLYQLRGVDLAALGATKVYTSRDYQEPSIIYKGSVYLEPDDTLVITKFRGSMAGNFTCFAFNVAGNSSLEVYAPVFGLVEATFFQSLFMAGYCTSAFLILGLLVGLANMVASKCKHRYYFTVPLFSKSNSIQHQDNNSCILSSNEGSSGSSEKDGSVSSRLLIHRDGEEPLDDAGDGSHSPKTWRPQLLGTLEDARGRLKYGVGRKMERVRKNVQYIKESGSVYVHSIVESGSTAARHMKAGVVLGVETVKCHVQSFKELCGTGDMGTQTISMVSVETDVDSNQRKEIINFSGHPKL
ncbi:leucine-rich repeat and fibronectin type III domain-containing protein 1-like protein [Physella acuta]|uniref:leucine-rich repeat and fibronectin type III domain-containing protein 1-like protein n=1 Tax=Physella acuta TaxID=109671 RepID=UPI0027DD1049|nr:leucine-rich repeat and fibronectin type III domain-containing protein 1-like protein [Physella acuta]XP_059160472.1 leucine-rich repeat and fibronectin type III domain-containing protein 1-like protein [Physella acuta]XP_059160474.1 leucine-rich repeat and fibronectin type III domain-containing protein 1-like protein [Physella acuta]XP_059160475.1 leucine-rich repeat and fibronectin type III domain-containing protein 1-like protein [Physella acuta]XP_059160476.1 leucine-rich repeat and fibr